MEELRLGVNVDHVATLRQARGVDYPDPVEAARIAEAAGARGITVHLREDRRHIQDHDVRRLRQSLTTKLNLEMAAVDPMVDFALEVAPEDVCLVPERREELTTEGGLDVAAAPEVVAAIVRRLGDGGITTSLFVDPAPDQITASAATGAPFVELHTGTYCNVFGTPAAARELDRIRDATALATTLGLQVNAGHGLTPGNLGPVAAIGAIQELNIGHALVARAVMVGFAAAVTEFLDAMRAARMRFPAGASDA